MKLLKTVAHTPSERICIEESVSLHMSCASVDVQSCRKSLLLRRRGTLAARCFRLKSQTLSLSLHLHKILWIYHFIVCGKTWCRCFFVPSLSGTVHTPHPRYLMIEADKFFKFLSFNLCQEDHQRASPSHHHVLFPSAHRSDTQPNETTRLGVFWASSPLYLFILFIYI